MQVDFLFFITSQQFVPALAFCDWSEMHKRRRATLVPHAFPRAFSARHQQLNAIIDQEMKIFLKYLASSNAEKIRVKHTLLQTCGNVFINYFCSKRFDLENEEYENMIRNFDEIFYEVNMGYAMDFLPLLKPFYARTISKMLESSRIYRDFLTKHVVEDRHEAEEDDYLDSLNRQMRSSAESEMSWDNCIYALEDVIGGHAAVGNFLVKIFGFLATNPRVQVTAQEEIDRLDIRDEVVGLEFLPKLPYIDAVILEAIRLIASPIVPHVANQDTSIGGKKWQGCELLFLPTRQKKI